MRARASVRDRTRVCDSERARVRACESEQACESDGGVRVCLRSSSTILEAEQKVCN